MAFPISKVRTRADELRKQLNIGIASVESVLDWPPDELPISKYGVDINPENFASEQEVLLANLAQAIEKVAKDVFGPDESTLLIYVTGSTARLENIQGSSDIDLLAVLLLDDADQDYLSFSRFEKGVQRECENKRLTTGSISVSGRFLETKSSKSDKRLRKVFFRRKDLYSLVGKEYEASWSSFERASLLFESILVYGDQELANQFEASVDKEIYSITTDILTSKFPVVGCCLLNHIKHSGVLAKAGALRKADDNPVKLVSETGKVIMSRLWAGQMHLLALHMLYLDAVVGQTKRSELDLLQALAQPPIFKAAIIIPRAIRFVSNQESCLLQLSNIASPEMAKSLYEELRRIHRILRCSATDGPPPLWYRLLQVGRMCRQMRSNAALPSDETRRRLVEWSASLNKLLKSVARVSHEISTISRHTNPAFNAFHQIIAEHLHGYDSSN